MATLVRIDHPHPWLNVVEYPFRTQSYATQDGWISYVDEGRGRPIVFLHGAPLWSFSWRRLIREFRDTHRCVAPDMLGFGLSDKPFGADYSPIAHMRRFGEMVDRLGLEDMTLVVHDYSGPIGLGWAMENPKQVREIVIINSWMWDLREDRVARQLHRVFGHPLNRWYYRVLPASPSFFLPVLFADRHRVPRFTREQYLMPFVGQRERQGAYAAAQDLYEYSTWYEELWARRELLQHVPSLLMWGMEDLSLGREALEKWQLALPDARTVELPRAARYAMDDSPVACREALRRFVS